jgi:hypothetical protein
VSVLPLNPPSLPLTLTATGGTGERGLRAPGHLTVFQPSSRCSPVSILKFPISSIAPIRLPDHEKIFTIWCIYQMSNLFPRPLDSEGGDRQSQLRRQTTLKTWSEAISIIVPRPIRVMTVPNDVVMDRNILTEKSFYRPQIATNSVASGMVASSHSCA